MLRPGRIFCCRFHIQPFLSLSDIVIKLFFHNDAMGNYARVFDHVRPFQLSLIQGSLTEGEASVQLTLH